MISVPPLLRPRYRTRLEYDAHWGMLRNRAKEIAALPVIAGSPQYWELLELTAEMMALHIELELYEGELS